jgi:hypothetical protein
VAVGGIQEIGGVVFIRGNPNAPDDIYEQGLDEIGQYLYDYSPIRGVYAFGGFEKPGVGEALGLGGYNIEDGFWYGGLAGGPPGLQGSPRNVPPPLLPKGTGIHVSPGIEWTNIHGWEPIGLIDNDYAPVGAFFGPKDFVIYGYYNPIKKLPSFVIGGGVEFGYEQFPNLFNPDYWNGQLPPKKH